MIILSGQNEIDNNQLEQDAASVNRNNTRNSKSGSGSGSASDGGSKKIQSGLVRRDTKRFHNRQNAQSAQGRGSHGRGSSSGHSSDQNNMEKQRGALGVGSLTEKRPSITAEELTPIVLSQLQNASKLKEESRKLRRGSRSSNSSTPASLGGIPGQFDRQNSGSRGSNTQQSAVINSGSESECGEEARVRTAEAFMSGIQSAIQSEVDPGEEGGLSAELVGEVDSVLSKLMQSINKNDPSLMPLIVTLQASLKGKVFQIIAFVVNNDVDNNKKMINNENFIFINLSFLRFCTLKHGSITLKEINLLLFCQIVFKNESGKSTFFYYILKY